MSKKKLHTDLVDGERYSQKKGTSGNFVKCFVVENILLFLQYNY